MEEDNVNSNITFDDKLAHIINIYEFINKIEGDKKRRIMKMYMNCEMDQMINKVEEYYYKKVLKNRKTSRKMMEKQIEIYNMHKMIETFTPIMIAYQMHYNMNIRDTDVDANTNENEPTL